MSRYWKWEYDTEARFSLEGNREPSKNGKQNVAWLYSCLERLLQNAHCRMDWRDRTEGRQTNWDAASEMRVMQLQAKASQRLPTNHQMCGRGQKGFLCRFRKGGAWCCSHLGFWFLASRTVRQYCSFALSHSMCSTLKRQSWETNKMGEVEVSDHELARWISSTDYFAPLGTFLDLFSILFPTLKMYILSPSLQG